MAATISDNSVSPELLSQVRSLVMSSECYFMYFSLSTYHQSLYWSWIKNQELDAHHQKEYEKRRLALDEDFAVVYNLPQDATPTQLSDIRQVARECARKVNRLLRVVVDSKPNKNSETVPEPMVSEQQMTKEVQISRVRVVIDTVEKDVKFDKEGSKCELMFPIEANASHDFTLNLWLYDSNDQPLSELPLATIQEKQIHGANGFKIDLVRVEGIRPLNDISMEVNWEISSNQQLHYPLIPRYWLHKIPYIFARIGGQVDRENGRAGSYWRVLAPLFRVCVGNWATKEIAREGMECLSKLHFLLPSRAQTEAIQVLIQFCRSTIDVQSEISQDDEFVRLMVQNVTLWHNSFTVADQVSVLHWLAVHMNKCNVRTMFALLNYCQQVVHNQIGGSKSEQNQKLLHQIAQLNSTIQTLIESMDKADAVAQVKHAIKQAYKNQTANKKTKRSCIDRLSPVSNDSFSNIQRYLNEMSRTLKNQCRRRLDRI